MARVVFICDLEEGHLLPTFGLARALKSRGHTIVYLSAADNGNIIGDEGFTFYPFLEDLYPPGLRKQLKQNYLTKNADPKKPTLYKHAERIMEGAYGPLLRAINGDIYLVNALLHFDMLILFYLYNIRPVVLTAFRYREGKKLSTGCLRYIRERMNYGEKCRLLELMRQTGRDFDSYEEFTGPLDTFSELVISPAEFEIDPPTAGSLVHHIEPSLRIPPVIGDIYTLYGIPRDKDIVYASMGSQSLRHGDVCDVFHAKVIRALEAPEFRRLHLILGVDKAYDISRLGAAPANVTILNWAPQMNILEVSAAAIIHGGLGSIKECIYYGVPMIVFPQAYDQPSNAGSVVHHHLGVADDILTVTDDTLRGYLSSVLQDPRIRSAVKRMQAIYRDQESRQVGAGIIEDMLANKVFV